MVKFQRWSGSKIIYNVTNCIKIDNSSIQHEWDLKQIENILPIVYLTKGKCEDDEIEDKENGGDCKACLTVQVPNAEKNACKDCGEKEITNDNTKCTACPLGDTANKKRTECIKGRKNCVKPLVPVFSCACNACAIDTIED